MSPVPDRPQYSFPDLTNRLEDIATFPISVRPQKALEIFYRSCDALTWEQVTPEEFTSLRDQVKSYTPDIQFDDII